ncbi:Uncharacterised protein [Zhongshania aliphaticivorans]|uniref:Flagellar hook-length control protein-like C-terminal domain-containing protein n=1 Tax=Zhongshania aliphaticivorans TaxID=1470434 RepID=A0A5S9NLA4_9GAMM|nr:flagellar hook-length control protein FliK [Zhongshania aliphaticivorans]CAA0090720.1 Uncharacterised protein [Zhongshania aliphaticivorans]CAA0098218.1 Uncharacterised protein [Zhongshania aliphaticivorans]
MQTSVGSPLLNNDVKPKNNVSNSLGSDAAESGASFNKLLGDAQAGGSAASHNESGDQLSGDVDIFSDSLSEFGVEGGLLPDSGEDMPFFAATADELSQQEVGDERSDLFALQQSQLDWSKRPSALTGSQIGINSADIADGMTDSGDIAAAAFAKQTENMSDLKTSASLLGGSAAELSKPTTGFATAMQLSSAANLMPAKMTNPTLDVSADSGLSIELPTALVSKSSDASTLRAPVNLAVTQNALTDPAWSQAMSAKISWMAGNGVHTATMQLHPAELGSIHVQLSVQGEATTVQIQAQSKDTSELMEKMMPRLHSGLENQGLRLEEAKVSHNPNLNDNASANGGQQQAAGQTADEGSETAKNNNINQSGLVDNGADEEGSLVGAMNVDVVLQNSGVDYYA